MYFDFQDGHPDYQRVPSAITAREGVLLSIIVHLVAALVLVLLPKTEWWKARVAAAEAAQVQRVAQLQQQQRDQRRFVFVQPRLDLAPEKPPPPQAPPADRDRTAVTRERAPNPTNPQPFSRGNTSDFVEASPPPSPPQMTRNPGPQTPAPPAPGQSSADTPGQAPDNALRLPDAANREAYQRDPNTGARTQASSPLGQALRNLSRYAEQAAFENPGGGNTGQFGPAIQFDTKGVEFGPWIRRFIAQVKRNWFVPYAAMSLKGHVVITFNVHKNGALTELSVIGPSSVDSFNNAAFNALASSNPTEPLPTEYPSDQAFFTVTFYYNEPVPAQ